MRRLGLSAVDADDVAQQVFMLATQKLHEIAPGRERTFLYGVALRTSANFKRKAHRRRESVGAELGEYAHPGAAPDEAAKLAAARELLNELLGALPPKLRRVFVLASIEQLELAEIAELERIPQGTVASRLRRARALFAERLREARHRNPWGQE